MNSIEYSFYLIFTGNILFSWGLLSHTSSIKHQRPKDILVMAFLAICYSIVYNLVFTLVLVPMNLISLSPVLCTLIISFGFLLSQTLQKIGSKNPAATSAVDAPWLKNSLLFIVIALVSSTGTSNLSGFILVSAAALTGYFFSSIFLDAIIARIELEPISPILKGIPIRLITAGLMTIAFSGIDVSFFIQLLK